MCSSWMFEHTYALLCENRSTPMASLSFSRTVDSDRDSPGFDYAHPGDEVVEKRIGVELDGTRATVVEVTGHAAVSAKTLWGPSPAAALSSALADIKPGKKAPHIRVALVSSSSAVRKIDLTAKVLSDRKALQEAVAAAIPAVTDETAFAALVLNPDSLVEGTLGSGLAAASPPEPVDEAYRAISKFDNVEIVPPSFTLVGFDGLHLALRFSNAELTLVQDGVPTLHRQLPVGGLDTLASSLGEGAQGHQRLEAAINRQGSFDAIAEDAIRNYLRQLVREVSMTRRQWLKYDEYVPEKIHIFGPGARMREIHDFLEDEELLAEVDEDLTRNMAYIPIGSREVAVGAFLAGLSYGSGAPFSVYPSSVVKEKIIAARRRRTVTNRALLVLAALSIPLAAYFGPVGAGAYAIKQAESDKAAAQEKFDSVVKANKSLARVEGLETSYSTLASSDPRWSKLLSGAYSTASQNGVTIDTISAEVADGQITVSASAHAPDQDASYKPLTSWLSSLQDESGPVAATSIYTSGFSFTSDTATSSFQVRYTLDPKGLLEKRSLKGESK